MVNKPVSFLLSLSAIGIWFLANANAASPQAAQIARLKKESPDSPERVEMTKVQVMLDRALFRPGKIDGLGGEFTQKAADRYCIAYSLPSGQRLDVSSIASPYREYTVSEEDAKWVGPQASSPPEQEKLKSMPYSNLWECVAERFHCDLNFLHELNPSVEENKIAVGTVLRVPDVAEFKMDDVSATEKQRRAEEKAKKENKESGEKSESAPAASPSPSASAETVAKRLVILRPERLIEVYEGDKIIACFPCTPGSKDTPVPEGTWKVTGNVLLPYFRWDKSVLESGVRSETAYNLPPGPNNPVGIVWMGINRPSVGMHGTPTPDQIGRNESHGCIRLANWDAAALSENVVKGTSVEVK